MQKSDKRENILHIKDWPEEDRPREMLLEKGPEAFGNAALLAILLRTGSEIEPRYIYYWTITEGLRRKAEAQMTGSAGQRRVPAEFFDNFKIPLFPRSVQFKIVEILDAHDARIRTEEQYCDKLKLQKKGLMHDLLTGKVRVQV